MPKLIVKQEANNLVRQQMRYAKWFSVAGLVLLLTVVAVAAYTLHSNKTGDSFIQQPLSLSSAGSLDVKNNYQSMHAILRELATEFENLSGRGADDYQKNLRLLGKAESILAHLNKMDGVAEKLRLNTNESEALLNRHQFYKDYWQAKLYFRELRVSRFEQNQRSEVVAVENRPAKGLQRTGGKQPEAAVFKDNEISASSFAEPVAQDSAASSVQQIVSVGSDVNDASEISEAQPKRRFQFATPPPGVELPEGFCDFTQSGSCKPSLSEQDKEVIADAEAQLHSSEERLPGKEAVTDAEKKSQQRGFQFAKPPPGVELPEGFCDLTNSGSCTPVAAEDLETTVPGLESGTDTGSQSFN